MREQRFARTLLRDLADVREDVLERAVRRHELGRRLVADALHARHVVRRVADEREIVGDVVRRDAESLAAVLHADPLLFDARRAAASGIEQPHAGAHELLEILVARNDDDVHAGVDALPRQRADDVIGFVAVERENADVERVEELVDALHAAIEVGLQLLGELLARRLVRGIPLVAERQAGVVHPAEVVGLVRVEEPLQEVDDAPRGRRVLAAARGERARDQREERAIDQRVAVDEKESGRGWKAGLHARKLAPPSIECQPADYCLHALNVRRVKALWRPTESRTLLPVLRRAS